MKKLNLKALFTAALLCSAATASAIPAKPGIRQWRQADGSTLNVQVCGDEHHHFYLSEDNYLLVDNDGLFYFADIDDSGAVTPSRHRAVNIAERTPAVNSFLSTLNRGDMIESMAVERENVAAYSVNRAIGLFSGTSFPSMGDQKALVILVEFEDMPFNTPNPHDYFYRMLNEPGFKDYYGTGSARDYFMASSFNQFRPEFDVYGPVKVSKGYAYYGADGDAKVREMIVEACQKLDAEIDFTQYDRDNDGTIDNIYFFYAGQGEATSADSNTIWPHASYFSGTFDGKKAGRYACSNEWEGSFESGRPDGPGTICHEFSHVLGLPDLYDTAYSGTAFTPGDWDVMDGGCYLNNGFTPPLYSSQERLALGWLNPVDLTAAGNYELHTLATTNTAYRVPTSSVNEYYLLENRQLVGWDKFLPYHGMLIWHIHFNQTIWDRNNVNRNGNHQYVDIVEADNVRTTSTISGDPFPGSENVTSFTDDTTPSMKTWAGRALNTPITDITESAPDGVITFKVMGGATPCPAPTMNAAADITPRSFKASWSQESDAKKYLLSVYTREADGSVVYAPGYNNRNVEKATSFNVSGLQPSTPYLASVIVVKEGSESAPSNEIGLNTLALTDEYIIPEALPATAVKDNEFVANWNAVDGAGDYELTVNVRRVNDDTVDSEDFTGKISLWFNNSGSFYSNSSFCGKTIPSLKMLNGNFVSSPYASGPIHSLSFWNRGRSTSAGSIVVEALISDCWTPIATVAPTTATKGATTVINAIPADAEAIRVLYVDPTEAGTLYIDDLSMSSGGSVSKYALAEYTAKAVGNTTSFAVNGLQSGTEHSYTVKAVKDGVKSMASNEIFVTTTGVSSIDTVMGDNSDINVTVGGMTISVTAPAGRELIIADMVGRVLFSGETGVSATSIRVPVAGLYIVKAGDSATKTLVK